MPPSSPEQPPAPSEGTADVPLTGKWTKPYPPDLTALVFAVMATVGMIFFVLFCIVTVQALIAGDRNSALPLAGIGAFITAWETVAWRIQRTALHVNTTGIRVRRFGRTLVIDWADVRAFRSEAIPVTDEQIVIDLDDGTCVRAPVRYKGPWFGRRSTIGGPFLDALDYDETIARLERFRTSATL